MLRLFDIILKWKTKRLLTRKVVEYCNVALVWGTLCDGKEEEKRFFPASRFIAGVWIFVTLNNIVKYQSLYSNQTQYYGSIGFNLTWTSYICNRVTLWWEVCCQDYIPVHANSGKPTWSFMLHSVNDPFRTALSLLWLRFIMYQPTVRLHSL
jgi:hypothetical protein